LRFVGLLDHLMESGRRRTSRSCTNISAMKELAQSQESKPHTHLSSSQTF